MTNFYGNPEKSIPERDSSFRSENKNSTNWDEPHNGTGTKESFCGACAAVPLALLGIGVSAYGGSSRKKYRMKKKIIFWSGLIFTVLSLVIAAYYLWFKKDCEDCEK